MKPQKILVTGAQGFIGSHLVASLRKKGYLVNGPILDLFDFKSLETAVKDQEWDTVIHLAGLSHPPTCEKDPALALRTNLNGTALLVEGLRRYRKKTHLIFASTAQVYAAPQGVEITDGVVFKEDRKIQPQNLYAQTKWQAELILKDVAEREGLKTTVLRLFNHTHRSQSPDFFLPHLFSTMEQAKNTRPSQNEISDPIQIPVGNLDIYRDIGSLKDLIQAWLAVVENTGTDPFQIFNVCSGKLKNLRNLASGLAKALHLDVQFLRDENRIRLDDPKSLCGSHQKLTEATGWTPTCETEEQLLKEFLS